jgi:hypothetical protein
MPAASSDYDSDETESILTVSSGSIQNFGKNDIVVCELFNPWIHGFTRDSDRNVLGHYLVIEKCFALDTTDINAINNQFQNNMNMKRIPKHPWIRNYKNIVAKADYIRHEIAECIYLSGNENVAILKTFWVRIVQRAWKRLFRERSDIRRKRGTIYALLWNQMYGTWPEDCANMPSSRGILM